MSRRKLYVFIGLVIFFVLSYIFIAPSKNMYFYGHTMVKIKPARFQMGPSAEANSWIMTNTQQRAWTFSDKSFSVKVSTAYYIADKETTVAQYRSFVADTGFKTLADKGHYPVTWDKTNKIWTRQPGYSWSRPDFSQEDEHPVVCLGWPDAVAYCEWLTKKAYEAGFISEKWEFRLPTEQEWELAARGGNETIYVWGDDPMKAKFYANVLDSTPKPDGEPIYGKYFPWQDGFPYTSPVGNFAPNINGLYDMQGNAWEWCINDYFDYPGCNTGDRFRSKDFKYKVLRGGSWDNYMASFAVTLRRVEKPWFASDTTGFRVVLAKKEVQD